MQLLTVIILMSLCVNPLLVADDAVQSLTAEFQNKIFLIRGLYQDDSLQYGLDGTLKKRGHIGSWTTSFIFVTSLEVKADSVEITGYRVAQLAKANPGKLQPVKTQFPVSIRIDEQTKDVDGIRDSIRRVLVGPSEPLYTLVPEFWRAYVQHLADGSDSPSVPAIAAPEKIGKFACSPTSDISHPCKVGGQVKPPRIVSAPDPAYCPIAKAAKIEGTSVLWVVIDPKGQTRDIKVQRAVGFGLDEKAVEAVSAWKFKPATFDGKPVAVQINVEVNFRLY